MNIDICHKLWYSKDTFMTYAKKKRLEEAYASSQKMP